MSSLSLTNLNGSNPTISEVLDRLNNQASPHEPYERDEYRLAVQAPANLGIVPCQPVITSIGPTAPEDTGRFKPVYAAWVTDISDVGLGMLVDRDPSEHESLWIDLSSLVNQPLLVPIRMVYCTRLLSRTFRVGALFR